MESPRSLQRRLVVPTLAAVVIVAIGPLIRPLRDTVFQVFSGRGLAILGSLLVVSFGVPLLVAVVRVRRHRGVRYLGLVIVALALWLQIAGLGQSLPVGIRAQVTLAERVHIVFYGGLAVLLVRALAPLGLLRAATLGFLWATSVGVVDEAVQFLVPSRTGEIRDIAINAAAAASGALFAVCLSPPAWCGATGSARPLLRSLAVLVLGLGGFVFFAHLGYQIDDPKVGRFRSWSTAQALAAAAAERARRWRTGTPPTGQELCCLQDYFLTEASSHNAHRNERFRAGDLVTAWHADNILRAYYAPYLDKPLPPDGRLPRDEIDRGVLERAGAERDPGPYESPVLRDRIWIRPSKRIWAVGTLVLSAALWLASCRRPGS